MVLFPEGKSITMASTGKLYLSSFFLISLLITSARLEMSEAFVAEATEVIGVVRLGVQLVEYIYKVFDNIFEDSEISGLDLDLTGQRGRELDREVLRQYEVVSRALERMGQSNEEVKATMLHLRQNFPAIIR